MVHAAAMCLLAGCPPPPEIACASGAEPGAYSATLDEIYDSAVTDVRFFSGYRTAAPTCGPLDALDIGSVLPFMITTTKEDIDCSVYVADVALPRAVKTSGPATTRLAHNYQTSLALFRGLVTIDGCMGTMEIAFRAVSGEPFGSKRTDDFPPFLVDRLFLPQDATKCPSLGGATGMGVCGDTWVASLEAR